MKRIFSFLLFAALVLPAGCSKDNGGENPPPPTAATWDGTSVTEPEDLDEAAKTATIMRASDLAWLSQQSNASVENTFDGWVFTLGKDLDLGGKPWKPIAQWFTTNPVVFKGTFDGTNHTIKGLNVDTPDQMNSALFGLVQRSTIRNVRVEGSVRGKKQVAGICANAQEGSLIRHCLFEGVIQGTTEAEANLGGICGWVENGTTVINCHSKATIEYGGNANCFVGGIAGFVRAGALGESYIHDCSFAGKFEESVAISSQKYCFGGIVGSISGSTVTGCKNTADISIGAANSTVHIGGIIGVITSPPMQVYGCYNTGAITNNSKSGYTGGITGEAQRGNNDSEYSLFLSCYNTGVISPAPDEILQAQGKKDMNFEIVFWSFLTHRSDCYYTAADKPELNGTQRFTATEWPQADDPGWKIGNDPGEGKFWKSLGTPGTTNYPVLHWE